MKIKTLAKDATISLVDALGLDGDALVKDTADLYNRHKAIRIVRKFKKDPYSFIGTDQSTKMMWAITTLGIKVPA